MLLFLTLKANLALFPFVLESPTHCPGQHGSLYVAQAITQLTAILLAQPLECSL